MTRDETTQAPYADDPRLTAYALGELEGDERAELEAALKVDDALLKELDALQKLGSLLKDELAAEPLPSLGADARTAIEAEARRHAVGAGPDAATARSKPEGKVIRLPWLVKVASVAAAVAVAALGFSTQLDAKRAQGEASAKLAPADEAAYREELARLPATVTERASDPAPAPIAPARAQAEDEQVVDLDDASIEADTEFLPAVATTSGPAAPSEEPSSDPLANAPLKVSLEPPTNAGTGGAYSSPPSPPAGDAPFAADSPQGGVLSYDRQAGTIDGTLKSRSKRGREFAEHQDGFLDRRGRLARDPRLPVGGEVRGSDGTRMATTDTPFKAVGESPLSTFSIDVDTASYSTLRKLLKRHTLPSPDSVRIEEMINYFRYDYPEPAKDSPHPFAVHTEVAACPWKPGNKLVRVALQGKRVDVSQRPTSNLVFLLDVSGSMNSPAKLPLLKTSLRMLLGQLGENDRVAIVVYAGASGLALPSTSCNRKDTILSALDRLRAGGSTNGGAGIQLAYRIAAENYIEGGLNRVILCTDGDFNVGVRSQSNLVSLIEEKAKSNVFLTVLGFGMNHSDKRMESLADKGNGHYAFIDNEREGRKVLVEELGGTLMTIAKDVKLQVEFNPAQVESYRLIGYANRKLKARDFADDTKDAGEIGAGHSVTAFYEIVPAGTTRADPKAGGLKYQSKTSGLTDAAKSDELLTVKLRYKQPEGRRSTLLSEVVRDADTRFWDASQDFRFASSVAAFGMLLRDSPFKGRTSFALIGEMAQDSAGSDEQGYRRELIELVQKAQSILR